MANHIFWKSPYGRMFRCIWIYKQILLFRFDQQTVFSAEICGHSVFERWLIGLQSLFSIRIESFAFFWPQSVILAMDNLKMGKHKDRRALKPAKETLTPYQGKKRSIGQFECCDCERPWRSVYSWANTAQLCCACESKTYPFKQVRREHKSFRPYFSHVNVNFDLHAVSTPTTVPPRTLSREYEFLLFENIIEDNFHTIFVSASSSSIRTLASNRVSKMWKLAFDRAAGPLATSIISAIVWGQIIFKLASIWNKSLNGRRYSRSCNFARSKHSKNLILVEVPSKIPRPAIWKDAIIEAIIANAASCWATSGVRMKTHQQKKILEIRSMRK